MTCGLILGRNMKQWQIWDASLKLSVIEENRYWVADDESKYTADFLFRNMNAPEFAEYMKDRGAKTIK